MRIALDGTPLSLSSGGLRRYTEQLAAALRREFPDDCCELLGGAEKRLWWSVRLPWTLAARRFDVFHGTNFEVPYVPVCASVMSVHDISPWLNPEWHSGAARVRTRTPLLIGLGIPTLLLTGTEAVRDQIVEMFRIPRDRVAVVPYAPTGCSPGPGTAERSFSYFLFVGTLEPRKNVPALVSAWRPLRDRYGVSLVLAGRRRADGPRFEPEPGLEVRGEVPDEVLTELYAGALAVVYPSFYEGFGLPAVEAMQYGIPVIASRDPALMEVSGGAAIHAADSELTAAMERLLRDAGERSRLSELGRRRAAGFSWAHTARLTREVYVEAVRRFARGA
jgi:glycosyltransferase involved in cell wall biosynthesis